jgi:hypothetical protein
MNGYRIRWPFPWRLLASAALGPVLGAAVWVTSLGGVHLYAAPRLQWVLVFPAVLAGRFAVVVHALQWITYAYLLLSSLTLWPRRAHLLAFGLAVLAQLICGLATAPSN